MLLKNSGFLNCMDDAFISCIVFRHKNMIDKRRQDGDIKSGFGHIYSQDNISRPQNKTAMSSDYSYNSYGTPSSNSQCHKSHSIIWVDEKQSSYSYDQLKRIPEL